MPNSGMPQMKERVPSIGSTIQVYSAPPPLLPNSSPRMRVRGKALFDGAADVRFRLAVGDRHRRLVRLVLDHDRRAEILHRDGGRRLR